MQWTRAQGLQPWRHLVLKMLEHRDGDTKDNIPTERPYGNKQLVLSLVIHDALRDLPIASAN